MAIPEMLKLYLDGLDASSNGYGFEAKHGIATIYVEDAVEHATIRKDALEQIRDYPVNRNSDPEVMATAIEFMQALATAALCHYYHPPARPKK